MVRRGIVCTTQSSFLHWKRMYYMPQNQKTLRKWKFDWKRETFSSDVFLDLVLWGSCRLMILMWEETTVFETKSWPWNGSRQTSRTLEETLARSRYLEVVASGFTSCHPCPWAFSTGWYKDPVIKTITVELHYSRIHYSRKLHYSRQFAVDRGFLFNKNPK